MAISTYKSFLMHSTDGTVYEKLVDIKSDPDMGGEPEMLDTTTMSNKRRTFIAGVQGSGGASVFMANYDKDDYQKVKALEGDTEHFAVWYGATEAADILTPTGSEGKFEFDGQLSVFPVGGGISEVRDMQISIAISTDIIEVFA